MTTTTEILSSAQNDGSIMVTKKKDRRSTTIAIKIILPTAFVRHTDGQKQLTSDASNLPGLLTEIDSSFPALATQIKDENGALRRFINVYVNDEDIRFLGGDTYSFADGDEVMLIPSIAGGSGER